MALRPRAPKVTMIVDHLLVLAVEKCEGIVVSKSGEAVVSFL